jgi:hypothetical protein
MIALAVVALLATGVQAGEIKAHCWPTTFVSIEITTIPVVMDIGYYIVIRDQDALKIKIKQESSNMRDFSGCLGQNGAGGPSKMKVMTNFEAVLTASVAGTAGLAGDWKVSMDEPANYAGSSDEVTIPIGTTEVPVCVKLVGKGDINSAGGDAHTLSSMVQFPAGSTNKEVAKVTIKVKPSGNPGCESGSMGGW